MIRVDFSDFFLKLLNSDVYIDHHFSSCHFNAKAAVECLDNHSKSTKNCLVQGLALGETSPESKNVGALNPYSDLSVSKIEKHNDIAYFQIPEKMDKLPQPYENKKTQRKLFP